MADLELLKQLRAAGVMRADFHYDGQTKETRVIAVEFFPAAAPSISPLDFDTLIPPANPVTEGEEEEKPPVKIAPALARLLKNGSVS